MSYGEFQSGILGLTPQSDEERDLSWLDGSNAVAMSEDGRWLLFSETASGGGESGAFYMRDLSTDAPAVLLGSGVALALSPDGKYVLAYEPRAPGEFKLVPTGTGPTRIIDIGDLRSVWAWFIPGRDEILFNGRGPDTDWRYYTIHPDGGEPEPASPEGMDHYQGQQPLAPDGRRLAGIFDVTPSAEASIYDPDTDESFVVTGHGRDIATLRWTSDGRGLIGFDRDNLPADIFRIDLATGERTLIRSVMPADPAGIRSIERMSLIQDGKYYAYNYRRQLDVLYVVEGLR